MLKENRLKAKIIECNLDAEKISEKIGINKATFYRKIKRSSFTIMEARLIANVLNLSQEEAADIFLA